MARSRGMTHSEKAKELRARWQPFPNLSSAGSYTYFSQQIELSSITQYDADQALRAGDVAAKLKLLPLLEHELQHLADHIATVWGRENGIRPANRVAASARSTLSSPFVRPGPRRAGMCDTPR